MKLTEAEALAKELFREHHLNLVGWTFQFDRATVRFGACHHGLKRITLSKALTEANDEKEVRTSLLHEIAHALVGHGHGHDYAWQKMCLEIGGDGKRLYSTADVNGVERTRRKRSSKFGKCPNCSKVVVRKQISKQLACKECCDMFNKGNWAERFVFTWSESLDFE